LLIKDKGYSVSAAAASLGITDKLLYDYMRYYNVDRLHSSNYDLSAVEFEHSLKISPEFIAQYSLKRLEILRQR